MRWRNSLKQAMAALETRDSKLGSNFRMLEIS